MTKRYRVELLTFPGLSRERAVAHLAEAFDLDPEEALIYIDALPCVVRSDIDGEVAKEYTRELLRAGADVGIVDEQSGHRVIHSADALKSRVHEALIVAPPETPSDAPAVRPSAVLPPSWIESTLALGGALPEEQLSAEHAAATSAEHAAAESAEHAAAKALVENVYCPGCGLRQPAAERCSRCGHEFGAAPAKKVAQMAAEAEPIRTGESGTDVDIFQSLRGKHIVAQAVRPLRVPTRRTRDFSLELPAARRRRTHIWVLLLVAVALGIALLLMQGDEGLGPGDDLPGDAIPPPPGLRYRPL